MSGFSAVVPLFLLIGIGYVAKRTVFDARHLQGLNQFVYYFAVPALLFNASRKLSLDDTFDASGLLGFLLGIFFTALVAWGVSRWYFKPVQPGLSVMHALTGVFSNYAYMGIPLTFAVLGDAAYGATVSIVLLGNILLIGGAQLLLEWSQQSTTGWRSMAGVIERSLLRSPIVLSTALGVSCSALQVSLPDVLSTTLDMLAPAAIPVALFCLGASLKFTHSGTSPSELAWLVVLKLFLHPLFTLLSFWALGVNSGTWMQTSLLLAALPTGALVHVVAVKYTLFEQPASQVVVVSTALSLLTIAIWVEFIPL